MLIIQIRYFNKILKTYTIALDKHKREGDKSVGDLVEEQFSGFLV